MVPAIMPISDERTQVLFIDDSTAAARKIDQLPVSISTRRPPGFFRVGALSAPLSGRVTKDAPRQRSRFRSKRMAALSFFHLKSGQTP
jgi:hypothetical protein